MATLRAAIHDKLPEQALSSVEALDATLDAASSEARAKQMLNLVELFAPNQNSLSLAVGGEETVLCFNYGHGNPPYFASLGEAQVDYPVLAAFIGLAHHSEFRRRHVVPISAGRQAAREFLATGVRPMSLQWEEV